MSIGDEIRELRKKRGLSQRALARYADVSSAYIVQLEGGRRSSPSAQILKKLAKPLGVEHAYLLQRADILKGDIAISPRCAELMQDLDELNTEDYEAVREVIRRLTLKKKAQAG